MLIIFHAIAKGFNPWLAEIIEGFPSMIPISETDKRR
jgi:hypothetical protein